MDSQEDTFEGWAHLELMGHRSVWGFVTVARLAGADVFKVRPWRPEGQDASAHYYGAGSLYALTPCSEADVQRWETGQSAHYALPSGRPPRDYFDGDYDEEDGSDEDDTYACDDCGAREPVPAIRIFSEVEGQPMTEVAVCRDCFEKRTGGQIVASSVDEADVAESVPF